MPAIRAAGVLLSRHSAMGTQFAVIHRPHRGDWSLPKGKLDAGETWPMAAVREVAEETGLTVTLGAPLSVQRYTLDGLLKEVRYWRCASQRGDFVPNAEVDELRWLHADDACAQLTYEADAMLVREAAEPAADPLVPLMVVRHAHAGDSAAWLASGRSDTERPVSDRGRSQLRAISDTAAAYGIDAVHTSPATRCIQTVEALEARVDWSISQCLYDGADIASDAFNQLVQDISGAANAQLISTHGDQAEWLVRAAGADIRKFRKGGIAVIWHRLNSLHAEGFEYYDTYPESLDLGG